MLRSIKQLYGDKLKASDGDLGHVKDFYFDDQDGVIRYLVADTGSWLPGRQVLLVPHSLGRLDQAEKALCVNLTKKQIEDSPSIAAHKPVSRQYEEEYYQYFGLPTYWQGGGLWGLNELPILTSPPIAVPSASTKTSDTPASGNDAHLLSAKAVDGYHIRTADGVMIGHICDFMMDAQSWAIGQLLVKTGHRLSGQEVVVPMKAVERISYEESTVHVNLTSQAILHGPESESAPAATVG